MSLEFNYQSLTPTAFLRRAAYVFGDRIGVIDADTRFTYATFHERCRRMAGALRAMGVAAGDRVAVLAPNTHVLLAAHYAVPFAGAVLVALNTRITPADIAYILRHAGVSVLIYDIDFRATAEEALIEAAIEVKPLRAGGSGDELEAAIARLERK